MSRPTLNSGMQDKEMDSCLKEHLFNGVNDHGMIEEIIHKHNMWHKFNLK